MRDQRPGLGSAIRVLLDRIRKNVPAALLTLSIWLLWRNIDGRKVPYYCNGTPRHGTLDSQEDRSHLATFQVAAKALQTLKGFTGLGIALGKVPGCDVRIGGIDFDHVIDGDEIDPRVMEILAEGDCYAELSPSGTGVHILGVGDIGNDRVRRGSVGLEIYSRARYFTVTGNAIRRMPLRNLADAAKRARILFNIKQSSLVARQRVAAATVPGRGPGAHAVHRRSARQPHANTTGFVPLRGLSRVIWRHDRRRVAAALAYLDPSDYDIWIRAGMAIHLASGGGEDGFALWHRWSAGQLTGQEPDNYKGPGDCRARWNSFRHGRDRLVTLGTVFSLAKNAGFICR